MNCTMANKFDLDFDRRALREWKKLDRTLQKQFWKKLTKLATGADAPSPKNRLHGFQGRFYKIKARNSGYRLVYEYQDDRLIILVVAVGLRSRNVVYEIARRRI